MATCASALTPASVRAAPCTRTQRPQIAFTAASSAPWYRGTVVLVLPAAEGPPLRFDGQLAAGHIVRAAAAASRGVPFKKAPAFIGGFRRVALKDADLAPSPQAIVRRSSKRFLLRSRAFRQPQRRSLNAHGPPSTGNPLHQAPGNGDRP